MNSLSSSSGSRPAEAPTVTTLDVTTTRADAGAASRTFFVPTAWTSRTRLNAAPQTATTPAAWKTTSQPETACRTRNGSRTSPQISLTRGVALDRVAAPSAARP